MKRLLAPLFALGILLSACSPVADNGTGPIKIGVIAPLTGDVSAFGTDMMNAILMAVEEVNADGGINGREIKLIAEDARCTGADSASATQKLVNVDKVVAIIGGLCSGETLAAAPIVESAGIPLLSPASSSPDITQAGDFIFRNYPSDALKTVVMADYIKELGLKNVAIITENTDYATALRNALVENVGEDNVVFDELVDPNTKDFRTLMTRLKDVDFDVFVPNGQSDSTVAAMMPQLREQGLDQLALGTDIADSATLADIAKEAVEGMQLVNTSSELGAGGEDSFISRFIVKYGDFQGSSSFAALSYDAVGVLAAAISSVGTDGEAIRDYLYAHPYTGVAGTFSFDDNGDVVGIGYALKEFQDGTIVELRQISAE